MHVCVDRRIEQNNWFCVAAIRGYKTAVDPLSDLSTKVPTFTANANANVNDLYYYTHHSTLYPMDSFTTISFTTYTLNLRPARTPYGTHSLDDYLDYLLRILCKGHVLFSLRLIHVVSEFMNRDRPRAHLLPFRRCDNCLLVFPLVRS